MPELAIERFELEDGDFVECFWHQKPSSDTQMPIVILFHGLEGSVNSPYIKGMMQALAAQGFATVLMHFRGCSGTLNRLARSYHSGDTADAKAWIEHVASAYPNSPLYGAGFSLGANMLLKLMGEWQENALLKKAVAVSAPMELERCADRMNRGFSRVYQASLIKNLNATLLKKYESHPMQRLIGLDQRAIKKIKTFWEFDDAYTAPIHGFASAKEYYERSSARQYLRYIQKETLIIHSLDDPFMTPDVLPNKEELSLHVKLEVSAHGGHVGFVGGTLFNPRYWLEERICGYFLEKEKVYM